MASVPRPAGVAVMGYLNIILGLLSLVCCLPCGMASVGLTAYGLSKQPAPVPGQPKPPDIRGAFQAVDAEFPTAKWSLVAQTAAFTVLSLTLAVSGFGMLKLKPSGRSLGLFTAYGLIAYFLASLAWTFVEGNAATIKFLREYDRVLEEAMEDQRKAAPPNAPPPPPIPKMSTMLNGPALAASNVVSTIFYLAYPLALLGVLLSKEARAAFAAAAVPEVPPA